MNRLVPVLGVLLLASLLGNILLGVRLSRAPEVLPTPHGSTSSTARPASERGSTESLQESLQTERRKTAELQARIERLETDKKVLAQEGPGGPSKADRLTAFREKLRRMKKIMSEPSFQSGSVDPDSMTEFMDAMTEFYRITAARTKEPKLYGDYLQSYYDVMLDGEGTSLNADQAAALSTLFRGYGEDLSKVPASPAGPRMLAELQLEAGVFPKLQSLLNDAQRAALSKNNMEAFPNMTSMSTNYISKEGAVDSIASQWTQQYQLDAAQLPQAKVAAQAYLNALDRITADFKGEDPTVTKAGSAESYDYRIRTVREQLAALNLLQASMTSAQQERLLNRPMQEIRILNGAQFQVTTTPEK